MWVKIDDGMATHPKLLKAGPLALAIQIRAICYASQNKTDGFLPFAVVPILVAGIEQDITAKGWAEIMVLHGLWDKHNEGYNVHDFLQWNVSKHDQEKWKRKLSLSGRKGMKSRWNKEKSNITKVITNPVTTTSTSISISSSDFSLQSEDGEERGVVVDDSSVVRFQEFWQAYPARNGKKLEKGATDALFRKLSDEDQALVAQAARNYADALAHQGINPKDPKRFLRSGNGEEPWRDWLTPATLNTPSRADPHGMLAGMKAFLERGT